MTPGRRQGSYTRSAIGRTSSSKTRATSLRTTIHPEYVCSASRSVRQCSHADLVHFRQAFAFAREFLFGDNTAGRVLPDGLVSGGQDAALAVDAIRGQEGIYVGSVSTTSTFTYPSATIAAWDVYIVTATAIETTTPSQWCPACVREQ